MLDRVVFDLRQIFFRECKFKAVSISQSSHFMICKKIIVYNNLER